MKRKLINYDVFKQIERNSLQTAERELVEASESLSKALNRENLKLFSINESDATFTNDNGTLIHATYIVNDDTLIVENIEELVVDQDSQLNEGKNILMRWLIKFWKIVTI